MAEIPENVDVSFLAAQFSRVLQDLGTIKEQTAHIPQMRSDIAGLQIAVAAHRVDTNAIKVELAEFKSGTKAEFAELRAELSEFKSETKGELRDLKGDLRDLKRDVRQLRTDVGGQKKDTADIKKTVYSIDERLTRVEKAVGLITA